MQETIGTNILDYFYDANGNPLAVKYRTSANATGTYYYYARNSRGDVIGLYNAAGSLYRTYSYDVWGNILSIKDANGNDITSQTDIANLQSLRYRGYYYDSDTGLYYLQSRYYDPVTHRFINADGLVSTGTGVLDYNMFVYCNNSPIIHYDYNGKEFYYTNMTNKQAMDNLASGEHCDYTIMDVTRSQMLSAKYSSKDKAYIENNNACFILYSSYSIFERIDDSIWGILASIELDFESGLGFGGQFELGPIGIEAAL